MVEDTATFVADVSKIVQKRSCLMINKVLLLSCQTWYFNLDPYTVRTTGYCSRDKAVLSLTLPDNVASLLLTFRKVRNTVHNKTKTCSNTIFRLQYLNRPLLQ